MVVNLISRVFGTKHERDIKRMWPLVEETNRFFESYRDLSDEALAAKTAEFERAMHEMIPLGRPQTGQDMGAAAVFLASAPNITGVSLSVAGGYEMN